MKVLWFVNDEFPPLARHFGRLGEGGGGWWMKLLATELALQTDIKLVIVCCGLHFKSETRVEIRGITYYGLPYGRFEMYTNHIGKQLRMCHALIHKEKPNLIHVFGSEHFWGRVAIESGYPSVLRLQGILNCYIRWFNAQLPFWAYLKYPFMLIGWWSFFIRLKQERAILEKVRFFEGQTTWDQSIAYAFNPLARYYHNMPLIREPFFGRQWAIDSIAQHAILLIGSPVPYKGLHVAIHALRILVREFPDCMLTFAGGISFSKRYGAYCSELITSFNLESNVKLVGVLDGVKLAEHMSRAHLFLLPSFDENESNSLLEAMCVGLPCVVSGAGGIPSMVEHGKTALLVPPGQPEMMAAEIRNLFLNPSLAQQLSQNARALSQQRHNPQTIVQKTMQMYEDILCRTSPAGQK